MTMRALSTSRSTCPRSSPIASTISLPSGATKSASANGSPVPARCAPRSDLLSRRIPPRRRDLSRINLPAPGQGRTMPGQKTTSRTTKRLLHRCGLPAPRAKFRSGAKLGELSLLGTKDRVLERLGGREAQSRTRGNLDGLAGGGVTAHACLGLTLAKDTESRQAQGPFLLELSHHEVGQFLERALCLLLGHTDLVGEMGCYLRLRHHPPPCRARLRGHGVSVTN